MTVTLGLSGNIGRDAVAMGHADAYSVGLGMLEKVNHAQTMARLRKEPDPDKEQGGGAAGGIYLSRLGATVSAKAARQLLNHTAELLFQVLTEREEEELGRHCLQRQLLGLDQNLHRPTALRGDRGPTHVRRQHHRDRHRQLSPGPHQGPNRRNHLSTLSGTYNLDLRIPIQ